MTLEEQMLDYFKLKRKSGKYPLPEEKQSMLELEHEINCKIELMEV